ncbi:MerR family transcriptional regulator [Mycobacterium hackensackense]|uniref:MerR family transcriptional regulator n=1 Tax=Mycobacterium hackensackense TaxID=228909 RepID=UPI002265A645|nr:MerR family transcriptional regulator [Mycobacterium hackensackense]MCV7256655.1 MerR family transcriptional regulator [Mycobacterium hackensackense]
MPIDLAVPVLADLTIQQVARRTGLSESALRYYERIGLLDPVPRDPSSGHRRYPPELVTAVESLACLRGTGMSVRDMRTYVDNMRGGPDSAADQQRLFAAHAQRLGDEIRRLQVRRRYVAAKADMWAARQCGDSDAEQRLIPEIIALGNRLLEEEATHHD